MGGNPEDDPFDIPAFLKRDANNETEFIKMANSTVSAEDHRPAKTKVANGVKPPVKAADKAKVKAAPKPAVKAAKPPKAAAKPVKAPAKPKAAKVKAEAAEKDAWGFRKGSAKSNAVALYARKGGATLAEVKEAVGSVQLNVLGGLEEAGHEVKRTKEEREGQRSVTRYFLKPKK